MFQMSKVRQWQHVEVACIRLAGMAAVCRCSADRSEKPVTARPGYWGDRGGSISVTLVLL